MSGGIYSGSYGTVLYLGQDTVTITSNATIDTYNRFAVEAGSPVNLTNAGLILAHVAAARALDLEDTATVVNTGTVEMVGTSGFAVHEAVGGYFHNEAGGLIKAGLYDVGIYWAAGTVANDAGGSIVSTGTAISGGAYVSVTNAGYIDAVGGPAIVLGDQGSVTNAGILVATGAAYPAVHFLGDGSLSNEGTISSASTGIVFDGAGTLDNQGVIYGADVGVAIAGVASVTNGASGTIAGYGGLALQASGTVINAGTIEATDGGTVGVTLHGGGLLVDDPTGVFGGQVDGGGGTLELATVVAGDSGTIAGLGSQITNFASVTIDPAARWIVTGSGTVAGGETLTNDGTLVEQGALTIGSDGVLVNAGKLNVSAGSLIVESTLSAGGTIGIRSEGTLALEAAANGTTIAFRGTGLAELSDSTGITIQGFATGDEIGLGGVTYGTRDRATYQAGQITVLGATGQTLATLAAGVSYAAGGRLSIVDDGGHVGIVEAVCFLAGTRILTDRGEVAVEALAVGDRVATASGKNDGFKPIKWIGERRIQAARHSDPEKIHPVRIRRGAFGDGVPHRDLLVSPGHAIFAHGVLLPARLLINGVTVVQDFSVAEPWYFHVELDRHDVLVAEGLGAESYIDSGNRGFFRNGGGPVTLHGVPDAPDDGAARCAPLRNAGPEAASVKRRLIDRLRCLGYVPGERPELRLDMDGQSLIPISAEGGRYRFVLPAAYREARLVTRWTIGGATQADNFDARRLGVAVLGIAHHGADGRRGIGLGTLGTGWHGFEQEAGRHFRWTDGDAHLPISGPGLLEVHVLRPAERWLRAVESAAIRYG